MNVRDKLFRTVICLLKDCDTICGENKETCFGQGDIQGNTTRADNVSAVRSYVKRHRPDAIVCCNDAVAAMLKQTLEVCGISVPKDIMLVGFDEVNIARLMQMTSVRQPCESIARAAFKRLLDRIEEPSMAAAEIYLTAPLVCRRSTEREPCQADRSKEKVQVATSKTIAKKRTRP